MPSVTIADADKAVIKRAVLQEPGKKIITAAVARLYYAHPEDPKRWIYANLSGAVVLLRDTSRNVCYLKLVDLAAGRGVLWEHEMYDGFVYHKEKAFFHTFATDARPSAFSFADESEAVAFYNKVAKAYSTSSVLKAKSKGKSKKIDKTMIGLPSNFKHLSHIGWDAQQGFSAENISPDWKKLLAEAGVTEEQMNDESTRKFVVNFVQSRGGPCGPAALPSSPSSGPKGRRQPPPPPPASRTRRVPPPLPRARAEKAEPTSSKRLLMANIAAEGVPAKPVLPRRPVMPKQSYASGMVEGRPASTTTPVVPAISPATPVAQDAGPAPTMPPRPVKRAPADLFHSEPRGSNPLSGPAIPVPSWGNALDAPSAVLVERSPAVSRREPPPPPPRGKKPNALRALTVPPPIPSTPRPSLRRGNRTSEAKPASHASGSQLACSPAPAQPDPVPAQPDAPYVSTRVPPIQPSPTSLLQPAPPAWTTSAEELEVKTEVLHAATTPAPPSPPPPPPPPLPSTTSALPSLPHVQPTWTPHEVMIEEKPVAVLATVSSTAPPPPPPPVAQTPVTRHPADVSAPRSGLCLPTLPPPPPPPPPPAASSNANVFTPSSAMMPLVELHFVGVSASSAAPPLPPPPPSVPQSVPISNSASLPAMSDGRADLLASIRSAGVGMLKPASSRSIPTSRSSRNEVGAASRGSESPARDDLASALATALAARSKAVTGDSSDEEDDGEEWD